MNWIRSGLGLTGNVLQLIESLTDRGKTQTPRCFLSRAMFLAKQRAPPIHPSLASHLISFLQLPAFLKNTHFGTHSVFPRQSDAICLSATEVALAHPELHARHPHPPPTPGPPVPAGARISKVARPLRTALERSALFILSRFDCKLPPGFHPFGHVALPLLKDGTSPPRIFIKTTPPSDPIITLASF